MRISVIIPTLNEAADIAQTIRTLRAQKPHEIIVADGGSDDGTPLRAREADMVLSAPRGRARQMNAGAGRATGDVLLFLHADCTLEPGALDEVRHLLTGAAVLAGCFSMWVQAPGFWYRSIEACAAARVRLTGLIYGDQGMFLRRADFEKLGGFPVLWLMEDLFFSRRLRRLGRVIVARRRILVSPRRWQQSGVIRQTLRNWLLTVLAAAGVHPDRLAQFYPRVR
jgi:rSAM/selenodomain-associated transferase 2